MSIFIYYLIYCGVLVLAILGVEEALGRVSVVRFLRDLGQATVSMPFAAVIALIDIINMIWR